MPIGIRPINNFAFMKTFGSIGNKPVLISLLNAILNRPSPITDVTLENPYNLPDFADDKLSILDIKAVDQSGATYDIEMQLTVFAGLIQRIVFYGCELYAGQLNAGDDYSALKPAFSICLVDGILWKDATQVHHAFRLTDQESGRTLDGTLEIHTLELGRYNRSESELADLSMLDCWLYWLLHAHEYEPDELLRLFPQAAIQQATRTITQIAEITEDKAMYDAREKAIRDQQWALKASYRDGETKGKTEGKIEGEIEGKIEGKIEGEKEGRIEGKKEGRIEGKKEGRIEGKKEGRIEGKIEMIRTLQGILQIPVSDETDLRTMSLSELETMTSGLQEKLRNRITS